MSTESDDDLVAAIRTGNEDAASRFDVRFRLRAEAMARQRGVPPQDCKDLAQEVMVSALRQIRDGKYRGEAALGTWLFTIVRHKIADHWRARRGPATVSLTTVEHATELASERAADEVLWVQQALDRLPEADRLILHLHEREGYTLHEIGQLLGLRKSAVGERLQKARDLFRATILGTGNNRRPERLRGRED